MKWSPTLVSPDRSEQPITVDQSLSLEPLVFDLTPFGPELETFVESGLPRVFKFGEIAKWRERRLLHWDAILVRPCRTSQKARQIVIGVALRIDDWIVFCTGEHQAELQQASMEIVNVERPRSMRRIPGHRNLSLL